jgi:hypothetical protein
LKANTAPNPLLETLGEGYVGVRVGVREWFWVVASGAALMWPEAASRGGLLLCAEMSGREKKKKIKQGAAEREAG